MWETQDLLDPIAMRKLGGIKAATLQEMAKICGNAVKAILGEEVAAFVFHDQRLAERIVPWVWDLATGFYYQSVSGPGIPTTAELVDEFSDMPLLVANRDRLADRIDWTVILTEDRIAQFIDGRDGIKSDPVERLAKFPWYERLLLGYRVKLTTEALRLLQQA
jgi:hypothetical protein